MIGVGPIHNTIIAKEGIKYCGKRRKKMAAIVRISEGVSKMMAERNRRKIFHCQQI